MTGNQPYDNQTPQSDRRDALENAQRLAREHDATTFRDRVTVDAYRPRDRGRECACRRSKNDPRSAA